MQSHQKFWAGEKLEVAALCEEKNTMLFYDNLPGIYYVVKKYKDGSIYHTRETQIFQSVNIAEVRTFIKQYAQ